MRLQGCHDGSIFATDGRDVLVAREGRDLERVGRLPLPPGGRDALVYGALTSRRLRPVAGRLVGSVSTVNVWPLTSTDLLATVGRQLLVSGDGGRNWGAVHRLPDSSGPMGVLPCAVARHDGSTYLGEYPLDAAATPRVLVSDDLGRSWSTAVALPDVRHVHAVQRDPYSGDLWVTTGDADAESQLGRLEGGTFERVGGGSQAWRAVELAFTPTSVLWGMDCVYADVNRIFELPREDVGSADPNPRPVHRVPGSVYYSATLPVDGERWVAFSTAMEAGRDSTGPPGQTVDEGQGVVVAASSASEYAEWHEFASYRRRRSLTDHLPGGFPRANGYVFLDAVPERGLLVNPVNAASAGGSIRLVPTGRLEQLDDAPRPTG